MQRKLKSIFRTASTRRKDAQSSASEPRSDSTRSNSTLQSDRRTSTQNDEDRPSSVATPGNGGSSRAGSCRTTSRRASLKPPLGNEVPIAATDYASPVSEEVDDSVADDYRAYMKASSPVTSAGSTTPGRVPLDGQHMSLGGDRRLITGESEMKYGEDIADRNIAKYGTGSRHGSLQDSLKGDAEAAMKNQEAKETYESREKHDPRKGSLGDNSLKSVQSPGSVGSFTSKVSSKYTLGTGVATEGSLIDGILPHVESPGQLNYNRGGKGRMARDERHLNWSKHKPSSGTDEEALRQSIDESEETPYQQKSRRHKNELIDLRTAIMDGQLDGKSDLQSQLEGIVDLSNTQDVDKFIRYAPAVTHEVVKPTEHHIREERIYREIHNHDVYHRVQPVYDTEILPARHFIRDSNNKLVEVSEDQLPDCTGVNQRWFIGEKEISTAKTPSSQLRLTQPEVATDRTYMAPEGFERRETTILHPPELEDMSGYGGPVLPVRFIHHPEDTAEDEKRRREKGIKHLPDARPLPLKELTDSLPVSHIPDRTSSLSPS